MAHDSQVVGSPEEPTLQTSGSWAFELFTQRVPYRSREVNQSQERLKGTQVLWFLDMQEQGLLHSHGKAFKSEATEYSSLHVKKKKITVHNQKHNGLPPIYIKTLIFH